MPLVGLLVASASAGQLWVAWAQGPQPSITERIVPASEGRLFDMRSLTAWQVVQRRMEELGFARDKIDRRNQVLLTRWRAIGATGMEWLPHLTLPVGYVAERIRFQVFVSPFVEPARIYIGCMAEAKRPGGSPATAYNMPSSNKSLMVQIVKAMGSNGLAIPPHWEQRKQLALSILKDDADHCLRHGPQMDDRISPKDPRITKPQKIPQSEFEFLYPAAALDERKEGQVRVEFTIMEDGGVAGIRLVDAPRGYHFEASAMGVASLLVYSPTKISGCPVPTTMTYTVRFWQR